MNEKAYYLMEFERQLGTLSIKLRKIVNDLVCSVFILKRPCKFYFHFTVSLIEETILSKPCLLNGGGGLKS